MEEARIFGFSSIPLNGKIPIVNGWQSLSDEDLERHRKGHRGNFGIRTGSSSKIVVVDIDTHEGGLQRWNELVKKYGEVNTACVRTGSGGYHYYFRYTDKIADIGNLTQIIKGVGIDFKTNKGQVVYPGSLHPGCDKGKHTQKGCKGNDSCCDFKGKPYEWISKPDVISEIPEWLEYILRNKRDKASQDMINLINVRHAELQKIEKNTVGPSIVESKDAVNKDFVHDLVHALDEKRADNYQDWIEIVWILRKLSEEEGLYEDLAHEFSANSSKYNKDETSTLFWDKYDSSRSTWNLGSLIKRVKEDISVDEYRTIKAKYRKNNEKEELRTDIEDVLRDDEGLCQIFLRYDKDMIISDTSGNGFHWNPKKLLYDCLPHDVIAQGICRTLEPAMKKVINFSRQQIGKIRKKNNLTENSTKTELSKIPDDDRVKLSHYMNVVKKAESHIIKKICNASWPTRIINKIAHHRVDSTISVRMNRDSIYELPIKGGKIINLKTLEVRDRIQDDLFSIECPVNYVSAKSYPEAEKFFTMLCNNDPELYRYIMQIAGYLLTGDVNLRAIYTFLGEGSNAKSVLFKIFRAIFGDFFGTITKENLMQYAKDPSKHSTQLQPLLYARIAYCSEFNANDHLDTGFIKLFTGDEKITMRVAYSKILTQFESTFKLCISSNFMPQFDTSDQAMIDRLRIFPCEARFTDNPLEGEFKRDPAFIQNLLLNHVDNIFSLMVNCGKDYFTSGTIEVPNKARLAQISILKSNTPLEEYIEEHYNTWFLPCPCSKENVHNYKTCLTFDKSKHRIPQPMFNQEFNAWLRKKRQAEIKRPRTLVLDLGYAEQSTQGKKWYVGLAKKCGMII